MDHLSEAITYYQQGKYGQAEKLLLALYQRDANNVDLLHSLALVYFSQQKNHKAYYFFQKALNLAPTDGELNYNFACFLQKDNRPEEAKTYYHMAISRGVNVAESHYNLAILYKSLGDTTHCLTHYRNCLSLEPNNSKAIINYANLLQHMGQYEIALSHYEKLHQKGHHSAELLFNIGNVYQELKNDTLAEEFYLSAVTSENHSPSQVYLYWLYINQCEWQKVRSNEHIIAQQTQHALIHHQEVYETPLMNLIRTQESLENLKVARNWSKRYELSDTLQTYMTSINQSLHKSKQAPLKVGYISGDFHDHATLHLLMGLFHHTHPEKVTVYVYDYTPFNQSPYNEKLQSMIKYYRNITYKSDFEAAQAIKKDQLDILIDLKGHTKGNRLSILSLRPAPIQIHYLGFPGSIGANYIDYQIVDPVIAPPDHQIRFTEKLIYLPGTYQATDDRQAISSIQYRRSDFNLPENAIVLAAFHSTYKIDMTVFTVWMEVMKACAETVLWIQKPCEQAIKNLNTFAHHFGVDPERIIYAEHLPKARHLKRLSLADLALDTFVCNGHTTTTDALFVGVPVITKQGRHMASRVASSLLIQANLRDYICQNIAQYRQKVIDVIKNPKHLKAAQANLRRPQRLFQSQEFTYEFNRLLLKLVEQHDDKT